MSKFLKVLGVVILVTSCIATILSLPILDLSILLSGLLGFGLLFAAGGGFCFFLCFLCSLSPV